MLGRAKRYTQALEAFEHLNTMEPQYLEGWLDHADLLLQLKGAEMALRKLREGEQVHRLDARYQYRNVSYLLRTGREQQALLALEQVLAHDHAGHTQLFEHYPAAAELPQVIHLVELYRK